MPINYFRRSRKDMVTFARCSDTSLTEETAKGRKTGASWSSFVRMQSVMVEVLQLPTQRQHSVGSSEASVGHAG